MSDSERTRTRSRSPAAAGADYGVSQKMRRRAIATAAAAAERSGIDGGENLFLFFFALDWARLCPRCPRTQRARSFCD